MCDKLAILWVSFFGVSIIRKTTKNSQSKQQRIRKAKKNLSGRFGDGGWISPGESLLTARAVDDVPDVRKASQKGQCDTIAKK